MVSAEDLLLAVLHATVALSAACLAVLPLRALLRRSLGAHAAYLAWIVVPCAMLATLAAPLSPIDAMPVLSWPVALAPPKPAVALPAPTGSRAFVLGIAWLAGAAALALLAGWRQRRFSAALRSGALADLGPVVIGVWRPRLWLPADFEQRFDAAERALILAHEQVHLRRRDNAWNLLGFALLATQWFNPLAWWSWQRMRRDQELSCDALALVDGMATGDVARAARYVQTLLKAQGLDRAGAIPAVALNAAPFFSHPLVERIRVIKSAPASLPRRVAAARALTLTAGLLAATIAVALESPANRTSSGTPDQAVAVQMEVQVDGRTVATPNVQGRFNLPIAVALDDAGGIGALEVSMQLSPRADDHVMIAATLRAGADQQVLAKPRLLTQDKTPARVETATADGAHTVAVTFTPAVQKPGR